MYVSAGMCNRSDGGGSTVKCMGEDAIPHKCKVHKKVQSQNGPRGTGSY